MGMVAMATTAMAVDRRNSNRRGNGNAMVMAAMDRAMAMAMDGTSADSDNSDGWHNGNAMAMEGTTAMQQQWWQWTA
jgi:hypothetical protein